MDNIPAIKCEDLHVYYRMGRSNKFEALRGINLTVEKSEFVALMGASGCGKSTLLNAVGGLLTPHSGRIFVGDVELTALSDRKKTALRREKIGIIFQKLNLLPTLSAIDNVSIGKQIGIKDGHRDPYELLDMLGLKDKAKRKPNELSVGEQQRVAVARALFTRPEVILADEPTGSLDTTNTDNLMEELCTLNKETEQTILLATHDRHVAEFCDRVIRIVDGVIVDE
ncbi:MAG: ABC transporter ATP-binding protein [bacterium]|nr:ABC transporter ATP-binding protein [bacterium]